MKRIGPTVAAMLAALLAPAFSAEVKAPSWTGFYAGLHGGWGATSKDSGAASVTRTDRPGYFFDPATMRLDSSSAIFGAHGGYNWQFAPNLVLGVEADITGAGMKGSDSATPICGPGLCIPSTPVPGANYSMERQIDWLASLRGRLGFSWGHNLAYVTGGAAWAKVRYSANTTDAAYVCSGGGGGGGGCIYPASLRETATGWVFGGGFETMLSPNWSVRAEYLRYAFDGTSTTVESQPRFECATLPSTITCNASYSFPSFSIQTVRAGLSYRF